MVLIHRLSSHKEYRLKCRLVEFLTDGYSNYLAQSKDEIMPRLQVEEKSGMTGFVLVRHSQAFPLASFDR
ncbi:hypothetical protein TNCV_4520291 [Trichonephila clavipes]|nr:hypothetical protein TNCV_4520291 [Trichonephila clavipes]